MFTNTPHGAGRKRASGFTLVEILIACSIVAILAAIALPSYTQYMKNTRRADAINALVQDAQALQRCYSQYFSYLNAACNVVNGATVTTNGDYTITVAIPTATNYTLTATPLGAQANDTTCSTFVLASNGQQTAQDSGGADQTATCWGTN